MLSTQKLKVGNLPEHNRRGAHPYRHVLFEAQRARLIQVGIYLISAHKRERNLLGCFEAFLSIFLICNIFSSLFSRSEGIGDSSISAVASGCPDLEIINTAYCKSITDRSLMSLSKCSKLNTLESRGCLLITPIGLEAIAMGCKQLSKLDIKKCHNIDDAGMFSLARLSPNLKQVRSMFL